MSTYSMIDAVRLGSGTRQLTQGDAIGLEREMDTDVLSQGKGQGSNVKSEEGAQLTETQGLPLPFAF